MSLVDLPRPAAEVPLDRVGDDPSLTARQRSILSAIRSSPGCAITDVATDLGLPYTSVRNEVWRLKYRGYLSTVRDGRTMRLVVPEPEARFTALSHPILTDRRKRRVVEYLAHHPDHLVTINQIAQYVGMDFGFVKRVLETMERLGAIHLVKDDVRYQIKVADGYEGLLEAAKTLSSGP